MILFLAHARPGLAHQGMSPEYRINNTRYHKVEVEVTPVPLDDA